MKVIALSDLHGDLPILEESADIAIIAGDISPLDIQFNSVKMLEWLRTSFISWINSLNVEKVYLVAGNHDIIFEYCDDSLIFELMNRSLLKLEYLCNESSDYIDKDGKIWKIFGTPYCHMFGNWAFMREDENLEELFRKIPKDIDILISHDAPYGCSDICFEAISWSNQRHIGNPPLRDAILSKNPKIVLHGHLHSSNHEEEILGKSRVYNVSIKNESYNCVYNPLILEL